MRVFVLVCLSSLAGVSPRLQHRRRHHAHELAEADAGLPTQLTRGFAGVAAQLFDLGRAEVARVDLDVLSPAQAQVAERFIQELRHAVTLAAADDVVVGLFGLQHAPHRLDVVASEAPVTPRLRRLPRYSRSCAGLNARRRRASLCSHEGLSATRTLVIKQDAAAGKEAVGLAVVDGRVVTKQLGGGMGRNADETASSRSAGPAKRRTSRTTRLDRSADAARGRAAPLASARCLARRRRRSAPAYRTRRGRATARRGCRPHRAAL